MATCRRVFWLFCTLFLLSVASCKTRSFGETKSGEAELRVERAPQVLFPGYVSCEVGESDRSKLPFFQLRIRERFVREVVQGSNQEVLEQYSRGYELERRFEARNRQLDSSYELGGTLNFGVDFVLEKHSSDEWLSPLLPKLKQEIEALRPVVRHLIAVNMDPFFFFRVLSELADASRALDGDFRENVHKILLEYEEVSGATGFRRVESLPKGEFVELISSGDRWEDQYSVKPVAELSFQNDVLSFDEFISGYGRAYSPGHGAASHRLQLYVHQRYLDACNLQNGTDHRLKTIFDFVGKIWEGAPGPDKEYSHFFMYPWFFSWRVLYDEWREQLYLGNPHFMAMAVYMIDRDLGRYVYEGSEE